MIKIKIKKPGFFINIPGIISCRTPVEIKIKEKNFDKILSFLKSNGIEDYECSRIIKKVKIIHDLKEKKESGVKEINIKKIEKMFSKYLNEKFSNLTETLIDEIKKNKNFIDCEKNKKFREEIVEEEEIFIPKTGLGKLKLKKSNNKEKTVNLEEKDVKSSVDLLKKIDK